MHQTFRRADTPEFPLRLSWPVLVASALAFVAGAAAVVRLAGFTEQPAVSVVVPATKKGGPAEASPDVAGARPASWFEDRAKIDLHGASWRPMIVSVVLIPFQGADRGRNAGPLTVRIAPPGIPPQNLLVEGPTQVQIEVTRLRGVQDPTTIELKKEAGRGPVGIQEVRASYPVRWPTVATVTYAGLVGVFLVWFAVRRRVETERRWPEHVTRPAAFGLGLALLGLLVMVLRKPDAVLQPQLWAEDGAVFLRDALLLGSEAILTPYSGYLHLLPRLVAAAVPHVAVTRAPELFTLGAMVPVILVASLLASRRLPLTSAERLGCLLLVALPPMPGEVLLNLTNSQWVLGFVFVLLLMAAPAERPPAFMADTGLLALSGLTGPGSLVFAPLFVGRAIWEPSRGTKAAAFVAVVTASVQGAVLLTSGRLSIGEAAPVDVVMARLGTRLEGLVGVTPSEDAGFLIMAILLGLVVLGLVLLVLERAWPAATALAAGMALFATVLLGARGVDGGLAVGGERYFSLPIALVLWSGLLAWRAYRWLPLVVVAAVLWVSAPGFCVPPLQDLDWPKASACLEGRDPCRVPINPAGWAIDLPAR